MSIISFSKNVTIQNILFDEYFSEYCHIDVIAFNYDNNGNCLCKCDGKLMELDPITIKRIMYGASKGIIENYLQSIFSTDIQSSDITKENGEVLFRLSELKKLKKYDVANLAKKTLKEVYSAKVNSYLYFTECDQNTQDDCETGYSIQLYGNTKSQVFHRSDCKSFNSITCTSMFNSSAEAKSAGYKPCKICKP